MHPLLKAKGNRWRKKMLPRIEVYKVSIYTLLSELSNNQFLEVVIFAIMHPPPQNPLLVSLALMQ